MAPKSVVDLSPSASERDAADALLQIARVPRETSYSCTVGVENDEQCFRKECLPTTDATSVAPKPMVDFTPTAEREADALLRIAGKLRDTSYSCNDGVEKKAKRFRGSCLFAPKVTSSPIVAAISSRAEYEQKLTDESRGNFLNTKECRPSKRKTPSKENERDNFKRTCQSLNLQPINTLKVQIKKRAVLKLRKVLSGCTQETLPTLIEEINLFVLSLYSKGVCEMKIAHRNIKETHDLPPTPDDSDASLRISEAAVANKSISKKSVDFENHNGSKEERVSLGDGHASVPKRLLSRMNWSSYTNSTRKLLAAIFSREVLATHSLTGKPSPAFPNKAAKKQLDPLVVSDIVQVVVAKCGVTETQVRTCITTKCADECKMSRMRKENGRKDTSKRYLRKI